MSVISVSFPDTAPTGGQPFALSTSAADDPTRGRAVLQRVEGWFDSPDWVAPVEARPAAVGEWPARAWPGGKTLVVVGYFLPGPDVRWARVQQELASLLDDGGLHMVLVAEPDGAVKAAQVRRDGAVQVDTSLDGLLWFRLQLRQPDPRKYSPAWTSVSVAGGDATPDAGLRFPLFAGPPAGVVSFGPDPVSESTALSSPLVNEGTVDAWPRFAVDGPVSQPFTVIDVASGRRIGFTGKVPAGRRLVLDSATGQAWLGAAARTAFLAPAEWFPVPPGGSCVLTVDGPPDLNVFAECRSAWL
jgi:hypothetical protein